MRKIFSLDDLAAAKESYAAGAPVRTIALCSTGCLAVGADTVGKAFEEEIQRQGVGEKVRLARTGCHGLCEQGPVVVVHPERIFYPRVTQEMVPEIVRRTALNGEVIEEFLYRDPTTDTVCVHDYEVPFYRAQTKVVLRFNTDLAPLDLAGYIAQDGYAASAKALLEMSPEQVIEEVKLSGLRGRGGAGFPTGVKWEVCRRQAGSEKYVVCNADEGDPGAFMDRSLLEGAPHSVIEGMIIAGYAVGANNGIIYVRTEYPIAVRHASHAIEQAREAGFLGENILGSGFCFDISVHEGAGAFVCGEETALIASLEGKRGMPRPRPPFPAQKGYRGKPTVINNVETLANVPPIILKGHQWFASIGTENSKGTKIFALAGKVNNTGLVEVPMGTTLRQIVFDVGGGLRNGKAFKAAQMGGPSGGCVPAKYLDLPIDYEAVREIGTIMGSGGLIVMDEDTCMVDIARYFLEFTQREACGKCVPCRIGTRRMLEILEGITAGLGTLEDLDRLERLARVVKTTSLCGLGQTAPNPVLSTLHHFRDEYEAHVVEKRCPARYCRALISYRILPDACTGCTACAKVCPVNAISGEAKQPHVIDQVMCTRCGLCRLTCKFEAIEVV